MKINNSELISYSLKNIMKQPCNTEKLLFDFIIDNIFVLQELYTILNYKA